MQKVILNVDGMSCSHCENRVKKAVGALNGIENIDVNLKEKTVTIDLDPTAVTEKQIKITIEDQGYTVID